MRRTGCSGLLSLLMLITASESAVQAQTQAAPQLKSFIIEPSRTQPSLVLRRPMLTWWDFKMPSAGLAVGRFRFVIRSDRQTLAVTETEELTLNGPEQRIRLVLPAIDSSQPIDQLLVDVSYIGKEISGSLGQHVLHVPFASKMVFVALVAESSLVRKNSADRERLETGLKFENCVVESVGDRDKEKDRQFVQTFSARIDPADFPSEALSYCSYDTVIVMGDEFRSLRKPQLEALSAWVKAGGSMYVEPNGVLEPYHLDFLRGLVADDPQELILQLDPNGRLVRESGESDRLVISAECGIGTAVIRIGDPDRATDFSSTEWISAARSLWRARTKTVELSLRDQQVLVGPFNQIQSSEAFKRNSEALARTLVNSSRLSAAELLERLMPEGVRMVPFSVLAIILGLFVIVIGPGDYFGLGWLRMRKLTWLTFPFATIAVALLTVSLSNSYMSSAETRRAVVVRDVGRGGEIVRTNRFELLYIASSRRIKTEVKKGLFAPLKTGVMSRRHIVAANQGRRKVPSATYGTGAWSPDEDDDASSAVTEGRISTEYAAIQNVSKWTPQLNRLFSISGSAQQPTVDWSLFKLAAAEAETIRKHAVPAELVEEAHRQFGPQALVACFAGGHGWASDRLAGWKSKRPKEFEAAYYANRHETEQRFSNAEISNARMFGESDLFLWIYDSSVAVPGARPDDHYGGIFSLICRTAPKGNASCEDLALLDASDLRAWLLVIVVPEKDDTIVYRKLMRFEQ